MDKREIIIQLKKEYTDFVDFINDLNEEDFEFCFQEKWSAKQQLEHIVMCIKPLVEVFGIPKLLIEQNFGKNNKPNKLYHEHINDYVVKLREGGKAPLQYIPEKFSNYNKLQFTNSLKSLIEKLVCKIEEFDDFELENLMIPHPLLGEISLKEMLYNAIYHVQHHKYQTIKNLEN